MFILNFMRYLKGYVYFEAQGMYIERFMNLAARRQVPVWDTSRDGMTLTGCTNAGSYKSLSKIAKEAGVKLRVSGKKGMPFIRRRYRRRKGLLTGAAVFVAFILMMSQFIWRIEVKGTETMLESRIIEALEDIGISRGTFRWKIDVRNSERRTLLKIPELAWVALNIHGSTLRVEVDERVMPPKVIDPASPCNIVASESGQVTAIHVYSGQAMVSPGDAVLEGDILISGITQDKQDQNLFKHARGEVLARCEFDFEVSVPLDQVRYVETGDIKKRSYLQMFGMDLPLFLPFKVKTPYHIEYETNPTTVFKLKLPFKTTTEKYYIMKEEPVTLTERMAKEQSLLELKAMEQVYLADADIVERTMSGHLKGNAFELKGHYICILDIAEPREIYLGG